MKTNALRPGEFRICPGCSTRQKGLHGNCQSCGASLADAQIAERIYAPVHAPSPRPVSRGVRAVLVVGVVGAATIGMVLRDAFTNAAFDTTTPAPTGEDRLLTRTDTTPDASVYDQVAPAPAPEMPPDWYALGRTVARPPAPLPAVVSAAPALPAPVVASSAPGVVASDGTVVVVEPTAPGVDAAAGGGMVGLAPTEKNVVARRARAGAVITNDDLARMN